MVPGPCGAAGVGGGGWPVIDGSQVRSVEHRQELGRAFDGAVWPGTSTVRSLSIVTFQPPSWTR